MLSVHWNIINSDVSWCNINCLTTLNECGHIGRRRSIVVCNTVVTNTVSQTQEHNSCFVVLLCLTDSICECGHLERWAEYCGAYTDGLHHFLWLSLHFEFSCGLSWVSLEKYKWNSNEMPV